jgi:hypothetical protein
MTFNQPEENSEGLFLKPDGMPAIALLSRARLS